MTTIWEENFTIMGKKNSSVGEQLPNLIPRVFVTRVLWQAWFLASDQWNIHCHDSTAVQIWTLLLTEVNLKRHDCGRRRHACVIFFLFCTSSFSLLSLTTNISRVVVVMVVPDKCMWQNTKTDSTNVNCKNETNLTGIPAVKFQIEALRYCNFRIDRFEQWYFQSFQKKLPWMVFEGSTSIHNE